MTKLNPTGTAIVYSTFLGGTVQDQANAIAVDGSGRAYVTGDTYSQRLWKNLALVPSPGGAKAVPGR